MDEEEVLKLRLAGCTEADSEPHRTLYASEQEAQDAIDEFLSDTADAGMDYSEGDYRVVKIYT